MIVRNPLDVIPSWLQLASSFSHSYKFDFKVNEEYPDNWNSYVEFITNIMNFYFGENIDNGLNYNNRCPVLWIRYEDLVATPDKCLTQIMQFLLNKKDLSGLNAERRVQDVLSKGSKAHTSYSLKTNTGMLNSNAKLFTADQKQFVYKSLARMLYYFGYVKHPEGSDLDWTAALDHPEGHQHDPEMVK